MSNHVEYLSSGVKVDSVGPSGLNLFKIVYNGLLARSGATEVFAHVGCNADWRNADDYPMVRTSQGFETSVFLKTDANTLNVCFRDPAGNWDNNSGANYCLKLEDRTGPTDENHAIWRDDLMAGSYYWWE